MTAPSFASDRPVIRLRPKTDARRIRHGFPWAYANEVVTDRRTKALAPGTLATLADEHRNPLALVAVNPLSKIIARVVDTDVAATVDQDWFADRLRRALALRARLFDAPYYRLIHAEADGLPGVIIDRFGDTLVIQPNAAWADVRIEMVADAAMAVTGASTVLKNASGRARSLEGLDDVHVTLRGTAPTVPIAVPMNGATYLADVTGGQKTGLFFDQRPNHAFVSQFARNSSVLDVFSHVGGFALAALAAGAKEALAVDGSQAALDLAQAGAEQTGVAAQFKTLKSDAFAVLTSLGEEGARFEVVVCDPPAFAPNKSALDAGLRAYEKVARLSSAELGAPGVRRNCCIQALLALIIRCMPRSPRVAISKHLRSASHESANRCLRAVSDAFARSCALACR